MFNDENKMGGLHLLYESSDIESIKSWLYIRLNDTGISISKPNSGIRNIYNNKNIQLPEIIIQENKKYKIYG